MKKVLIIDHYDSFSYNLQQCCKKLGTEVEVVKCDDDKLKNLGTQELKKEYSHLILSPGPGSVYKKEDIGNSAIILQELLGQIPILGVCLGHQLLGVAFGATINGILPIHGKKSKLDITHPKGILKGLDKRVEVMRYHSMAIKKEDAIILQEKGWIISAVSQDDHQVMALEHPELQAFGVQFHPESIGTECGLTILSNFLNTTNYPRA